MYICMHSSINNKNLYLFDRLNCLLHRCNYQPRINSPVAYCLVESSV